MSESIISLIVSSIITTLCGAIIGYLISKIKGINTAHKQAAEQEAAWRTEREKIDLITLRMAIYDDHFDIDEKLEAYELYATRGGNHRTKTYMDEKVGMDVDLFLEHRKARHQ